MNFVTETSPHIRRNRNAMSMLIDVLIALLPVLVFACGYVTDKGVPTGFLYLLTSVITMEVAELIFVLIKGKGSLKAYSPVNALSAAVSGYIFALMLEPRAAKTPGMEYFYIVLGAAFGIILAKLVFGGFGQNIFNPAAAGFIFTKVTFGGSWTGDYVTNKWFDLFGHPATASNFLTGATPLDGGTYLYQASSYRFIDLFFGRVPGAMGEVCKLAILIGLIYLLVRRVADWRVVAPFAATYFVLSLLAGCFQLSGVNPAYFALEQLLLGGVLFGMTYMITDPVTMPITAPSRVAYGMIAATLAIFIRLYASAPEGMAYAILLTNAVAPMLDHEKWVHPRFNWKDYLTYGIIATIGILVVCLATKAKATSLAPSDEAAMILGGKF